MHTVANMKITKKSELTDLEKRLIFILCDDIVERYKYTLLERPNDETLKHIKTTIRVLKVITKKLKKYV